MEVHAVNSWYDQRHGVISVDDHVTGVIREIHELSDGRVHVYYNEQSNEFDLVETCLDGTDRLVFSVDTLDQRAVDRLREADHWLGGNPDHVRPDDEDFAAEMDRDNTELQKSMDEAGMERVRDAGERIAWAMEFDGRGTQASILVKKDLDGRKSDPSST